MKGIVRDEYCHVWQVVYSTIAVYIRIEIRREAFLN